MKQDSSVLGCYSMSTVKFL